MSNKGKRVKKLFGKEITLADRELRNPVYAEIRGLSRGSVCSGKCCFVTTIIILVLIAVIITLSVVIPQVLPKSPNDLPDTRCNNNECSNNSTCISAGVNYTCKCTPAYEGPFCRTYKPCWNDPCLGEGVCTPIGNEYTCSCGTKFKDYQCHSQNISVTNALVKLSDTMIAGGFEDNTVRIWSDFKDSSSRRILTGHTDFVRSIVKLPDGRLASGSCDYTINIWSTNDKIEKTLINHTGCITGLAVFSNSYLISASKDKKLNIFNLNNFQLVNTILTSSEINTLNVNLKLELIATGSNDATVKIYDRKSYSPVISLSQIDARSLLEVNNKILVGLATGDIKSYDLSLKNEKNSAQKHSASVNCLLNYNSKMISASDDATIKIWSVDLSLETTLDKLHTAGIKTLSIWKNKYLLSGSIDKTIRVWDLKTNAHIGSILQSAAVSSLAVTNNNYLVSATDDSKLLVWDIVINADSITPLLKYNLTKDTNKVNTLVVLSSGYLVSGSEDSEIIIWKIDQTDYTAYKMPKFHSDSVTKLSPTSNNGFLSSDKSGQIINWFNVNPTLQNDISKDFLTKLNSPVDELIGLDNGDIISSTPNDSKLTLWNKSTTSSDIINLKIALNGHTDSVLCLTFFENPRLNFDLLASGSTDEKIIIWNMKTFSNIKTLIGHQGSITALTSLFKGYIVSGSNDMTIKIWDDYFYNQYTLTNHLGTVTALLSVNENYFMSGSTDTSIFIWQNKTDLTLKQTLVHKLSVQDATQLPNSDIVTCSDDKSINIWNSEIYLTRFQNLTGHLDYVYAVDVLDDGNIVSASKDVSVRIWDPIGYNLVQTLYSHKKSVISVVAIKRNYSFASGSCDTTIKLWFKKNYELAETLGGHSDCVNALVIYNDHYLISGGSDNKILVRNLNTPTLFKELGSHPMQVNALAVFLNKDLATGSSDKTIKIWKSVYDLKPLQSIFMNFLIQLNSGDFVSSFNKTLAIRNSNFDINIKLTQNEIDSEVTALNYFNGNIIVGFKSGQLSAYNTSLNLISDITTIHDSNSPIVDVRSSTDYLVSVDQDSIIRVFNKSMSPSKKIADLNGKYSAMIFFKCLGKSKLCLCVTTDDKLISLYFDDFLSTKKFTSLELQLNSIVNVMTAMANGNLAVGCKDGSVSIYDPNSLQLIFKFQKHSSEIKGLLVLPTLDYLVSASSDGKIQFWDPITFVSINESIENNETISRLYFYNNELVSIVGNQMLKVWLKSPESLILKQTLTGHTDAVLDLAILNNGFLASASKDRTIKIWDNNLKNIVNVTREKMGHTKAVLALKVLKNNDLVSTSEDRTAKVWATDLFVKIYDLK